MQLTGILLSASIVIAVFSGSASAGGELKAARIVVDKSDYLLQLLDANSKVLKSYRIALGGQPQGPKRQEGDERTPEGIYKISGRNPQSCCHLSLRISYPNQEDIAQAKARNVSPGGDIMIHGMHNGWGWIGPLHRLVNWTHGCIAVTDKEIAEIWDLTPNGTPIEIRP